MSVFFAYNMLNLLELNAFLLEVCFAKPRVWGVSEFVELTFFPESVVVKGLTTEVDVASYNSIV